LKILKTALIVSTLLLGAAHAQTATKPSTDTMNMEATQKAAPMDVLNMVDGEVRKVDKDAKKITLKHGEIKNLGMPPMTMVFQAKDPTMLDTAQAGDKVRFKAEKLGGVLVVTEIQLVK
jgi:Cu(I)/Ag(I) efflux system protein CusF